MDLTPEQRFTIRQLAVNERLMIAQKIIHPHSNRDEFPEYRERLALLEEIEAAMKADR